MAATLPGTNELLAPSPAEAMEEAAAKKKRQEEGEALLRRTPPVKQESQMMPVACPTQPLNRLCDDLRKHFEQFGNAPKGADCVKALMNSYIHQHDDWRDYAFFHPSFYARNLVYADDHFELIVLCWKDGQMSPIHNHAGSSCWMGCLEGKIEETYYHIKEDNRKEEGICPNLEKGQVETHEKGEVAYIRDEIALHVIRPLGGNSVSLHIYSPPIKSCLIYVPALGKTSRKNVSYYTINKLRISDYY